MATSDCLWHSTLSILPHISGEAIDNFVSSENVVNETTIRGYKFFLENYIHDVQVCRRLCTDIVSFGLRAKCFRSMRKNESPHDVQISIDDGGKPSSYQCSCAAGQALCQHTIALLHQIQHYQKLGLATVPPLVSKTSLPQVWHVPPRTSGITARPVGDVVVQKPYKPASVDRPKHRAVEGRPSTFYNPIRTAVADINLADQLCPYFDSLEWANRPQFSQLWTAGTVRELVDSKVGLVPKGCVLSYQQACRPIVNDSIILLHDAPKPPPFVLPDLSSYLTQYFPLTYASSVKYDSLFVSETQSADYEEMTRDQSNTADWHSLRYHRLTASNFKRVCSRRSDFEALATQLLNTRNIQTAAIKFGIENEPVAAELYAKTFGYNAHRVGLVINPSCFFLGCSPDRRVYDPESDSACWGLLEIKCTVSNTVTTCDYLQGKDGLKLKKFHAYYYQVMGQMGLTGSQWCDFFVYARDDFYSERILFDSQFFTKMMEQLTAFFFNVYIAKI